MNRSGPEGSTEPDRADRLTGRNHRRKKGETMTKTVTNVQDAIDVLTFWTAGEMLTDSEEFRIIWRELGMADRKLVARGLIDADLVAWGGWRSASELTATDILNDCLHQEHYKRRCASDVDAFGKTIHPYVRKVRN